ncbi:MAG: NAD(P)/FAD-dependent oxidoreductase [Proteobacteria bacterium]|nr:NAD(P)/FAD-dependent oxidoreductase [Pseudomonadota bacterium]
METPQATYDVAIIGGGVVGTAIARELAQYRLNIVLLEAGPDVGVGTSKANTALFHTGFDAPPGSLEARLLKRSIKRLKCYAQEVGIPIEYTGGILVAWNQEQLTKLPALQNDAQKNGETLHPLTAGQIYQKEPRLGPGVLGGLMVKEEGIICPFTPPLAFATQAKINGVDFLFNHLVTNITQGENITYLACQQKTINAIWVINSAGLYSDKIDHLFGYKRFKVTARRGQLIIYDKASRSLLSHIILPVPTQTTKGVMVCPTVFGNLLLGPTAEDLPNKHDTATTHDGYMSLQKMGRQILPALQQEEITATYSGLRAATQHKDYQIHLDEKQHYICVGGIRSTGLSSSMGIAEYVVDLLREANVTLQPTETFKTITMPYIGEDRQRKVSHNPYRIKQNPDYGRILCHCEEVSRGEIIDAMNSPLPPPNLDGLRRRTRCLQGRCQGFYCTAELVEIMAQWGSMSKHELLAINQ